MFTSRAEYRLLLNHGSAELRLAQHAETHKLISTSRLRRIQDKALQIQKWTQVLETTRYDGITWANRIRKSGKESPLPDEFLKACAPVRKEVMYRIIYKGYLEREQREVERLRNVEKIRIPSAMDYMAIPGLRRESAIKLSHIKPFTLGQASRMSGVNPTDISLLMVAIEAGREGEPAA
jgi:tRNA uridine 5-carboxymethylaminomethyl modification enzyme